MIIKKEVTVQIYYWMPDYENITQQFIWQTKDIVPEYPRVHKFLDFWHREIDAVINEIHVSHSHKRSWRTVDWLQQMGH